MREAELWATTAALNAPGYSYPYEQLDRLWKTVLLHQFHDILPGSSIAWVHREAEAEYARVAKEVEAITAEAVAALGTGETRVFNTSPGRPCRGGPHLRRHPDVRRSPRERQRVARRG